MKEAYEEVKDIKRKYLLEKLGHHHKLIYEIVKKNPGITSSDFYDMYVQEAGNQGLNPKSDRTKAHIRKAVSGRPRLVRRLMLSSNSGKRNGLGGSGQSP
ncbi:MAG: hypothetical protein QXL27_00975 [Candidatus Bathyarchaeia archaeon]